MYAQIILLENEPVLLQGYCDILSDYEFDKILTFSDTRDIVERIGSAYTQPSILVTDYGITPDSPAVFLPLLRAKGFNLPVVVVSGRVKYNQLNGLNLAVGLAGYLEKGSVGDETGRVRVDLAQLLTDLNGRAILAWEQFARGVEADEFVGRFRKELRPILYRLLCNHTPKNIFLDTGISQDSIRSYDKQLNAFLCKDGDERAPQRYAALFEALAR